MTIEEILPVRTISPAAPSVLTAYNVVTHTSTITASGGENIWVFGKYFEINQKYFPASSNGRNLLQGLDLFQGLIPSLRYPALPPLPTTTFTTTTITEVSSKTPSYLSCVRVAKTLLKEKKNNKKEFTK